MANILYLVHRIPFPPNKGDKVRSYHLLIHLLTHHRVFLGTFIDDIQDENHIECLSDVCADSMFVRIDLWKSKLHSAKSFFSGKAMSVHFYHNVNLQRWIDKLIYERKIDCVLIFSSPMAQYVASYSYPFIMDFVDVDSAKWAEYASGRTWPLSWIYRREGAMLFLYEKYVASQAEHSFFVTSKEVQLFLKHGADLSSKISAVSNGVDFTYFAPSLKHSSPFDDSKSKVIVFTGAMDYWPNIDAVVWFVHKVFPLLRETIPNIWFYIVGRNPANTILDLSSQEGISVTGTVPDVRPFLQYATAVVAPLRVARGIQNKILEAMSMEKPVVASLACVEALGPKAEEVVFSANDASDYLRQLVMLLSSPDLASARGSAGRQFVIDNFDWESNFKLIDPFVEKILQKNIHGYTS